MSQWLRERVHMTSLARLGVPGPLASAVTAACAALPFQRTHIGGLLTNSPRRGVAVAGNQLWTAPGAGDTTGKGDSGPKASPVLLPTSHWTPCFTLPAATLETPTVPMPDPIAQLVPYFFAFTAHVFPDVPLSPSSYSLFVANEYLFGTNEAIVPHTDDQTWYEAPPVFISLTLYPDGGDCGDPAGFVFRVKDEGSGSEKRAVWREVRLPHASVCAMRADVTHRVDPRSKPGNLPAASGSPQRRRINLTFRNLASPFVDPLGYTLAVANHFRYYGTPSRLLLPSSTEDAYREEAAKVTQQYSSRFPGCEIVQLPASPHAKSARKRALLNDLAKDSQKTYLLGRKDNCVLESVDAALRISKQLSGRAPPSPSPLAWSIEKWLRLPAGPDGSVAAEDLDKYLAPLSAPRSGARSAKRSVVDMLTHQSRGPTATAESSIASKRRQPLQPAPTATAESSIASKRRQEDPEVVVVSSQSSLSS